MEAYEAFGDCWTMLELTESLLHELAVFVTEERHEGTEARRHEGELKLPFGEIQLDWSRPFEKVAYGELFERTLGFAMTDEAQVREIIRSTADKVGPLPYVNGRNDRMGHGRLNVLAAVQLARGVQDEEAEPSALYGRFFCRCCA